jgi:hypothetical protein
MKIVISESQYQTLLNELGPHNPKELTNLIKWIEKHTTCRVEQKNNVYTIYPPKELYPNVYKAHNTSSATTPIFNFLKNVYKKTSLEIKAAFNDGADIVPITPADGNLRIKKD